MILSNFDIGLLVFKQTDGRVKKVQQYTKQRMAKLSYLTNKEILIIMNKLISYILLIFGLQFNVPAQSTADLFSQEGLSINAYHYNFYDGTYNTSYTLLERKSGVGIDTVKFISNQSGREVFLIIQNEKVYVNNYLLYDFSVEVGDVIDQGTYNGFKVSEIELMTLLNGETRRAVHIFKNNWKIVYVEGIGDIQNGLIPFLADFEGYDQFVCAKRNDVLLLQDSNSTDLECDLYSCITPIPDFEISLNGFTLTTKNSSLYGNVYSWQFGDGQTSILENPTHIYQDPGCYTITLNLSSECYPNIESKSITTSICVNNTWELDYDNDSISLSLYAFNSQTDFVYNHNHLFKVTDDGNTWEELSLTPIGGEKKNIRILSMWDENRGLAGCQGYYGLMMTEDGGHSWRSEVEDAYWISNFVLEENGKAYVQRSVYTDYFYRTLDYGNSWETLDIKSQLTNHKIYKFLYAKEDLVYAQAFKGFWDFQDFRLGVSTNNGNTWDFLPLPFKGWQLQFIDELNGFGTDQQDVWYTEDGGLSWIKIHNLTNINSIHFSSKTHGWVKDNNGVILYSSDRFETYSFSSCGTETFTGIQPLTDSLAVAYINSSTLGFQKLSFNVNLIGNCNDIIDNDSDGFSIEDDCDDNNPNINPGQTEKPYNGIDDDCNAATLDDDLDQDSFLLAFDCDDNNPNINPDSEEIPNNGIDEDCDGEDLTSGISELANSKVKAYPNPVTNVLNIEVDGQLDYTISIYDLRGKKVYSIGNKQIVDVSSIPNGLYLLELEDQKTGQKMIDKLVILK